MIRDAFKIIELKNKGRGLITLKKLNQGDVLIFPSNFLYPHKVNSIKKGTRYSFVSWVW